jgi:hypothetical protein
MPTLSQTEARSYAYLYQPRSLVAIATLSLFPLFFSAAKDKCLPASCRVHAPSRSKVIHFQMS